MRDHRTESDFDQVRASPAEAAVPKFKSETTYLMNDALKKMGMPSAFSSSSNFKGMRAGESSSDLFISAVVHKAFVEVNEAGTEAAAATALMAPKQRAAKPRALFTPHFRADKPFIYMIRGNESSSILFLGRMNHPSA